jgi:hypothetical protein
MPHGSPGDGRCLREAVTARQAQAGCRVTFPPAIAAQLRDNGLKQRQGRHRRHRDHRRHDGGEEAPTN